MTSRRPRSGTHPVQRLFSAAIWILTLAIAVVVGTSFVGAAWIGVEFRTGSRWRHTSLAVQEGRLTAEWYADYTGCFWSPPAGPIRAEAGGVFDGEILARVLPVLETSKGGGTSGPFRECSFSALLLLPVVAVGAIIAARSTRRRGPDACRACGYPTAGLVSGICPECGSAVAPGTTEDARRLSVRSGLTGIR